MLKLGLKLGAVGVMIYPMAVLYREYEQFGHLNARLVHTFEARGMARDVAMAAGVPARPDRLPDAVGAFAAKTSDNPAQVQRAAAMAAALDPVDAPRLARLAAEAVAEEDSLIAGRRAAAEAKRARLPNLAIGVWVMAVGVLTLVELIDYVNRHRRTSRRAAADVISGAEYLRVVNENRDLRRDLDVLRAHFERSIAHQGNLDSADRLIREAGGGDG